MAQTDKKNNILRDLRGDLFDSDHATRRFFRCWLDGSYFGENDYRRNVQYLRDALKAHGVGIKLERKITPWVVGQFVRYTAHEADCSSGYAQKVIVEHFNSLPNPMEADLLGSFTTELISDALDLIVDDIREHLAEKEAA